MSLISTRPLKMILALSLILTLARCPGGGSSDSSAALLGLLGGGGSASNTAATLPQCTAALCLNGNVSSLISGATLVIANGAKTYTLPENGSFGLNAQTDDNYTITVQTQPTTLRCIVTNGTGTVEATSIDNIVVTCPMAYKDNLVWNRCSHGQQWNATAGDCTGTGNSGNGYGAIKVQYCSTNDNACNDADADGEIGVNGHLNGNGTSSLYSACDSLNAIGGTYGYTTWRVPRRDEMKQLVLCSAGPTPPLADEVQCAPGSVMPTINSALFPNTPATMGPYGSSSSTAGADYLHYRTNFSAGMTAGGYNKNDFGSSEILVRCVSTGP